MSLWQRFLAAVAPRAAMRSAAASTAQAEVRRLRRHSGKRLSDVWDASDDWSRNTGRVEDALPRTIVRRQRVRRILATNPYAAKVRQTLLNNLVGFGIVGIPAKAAPKKVAEAWKQWVKVCDWLGRLDFYGLQDLAVSTMLGDGECFIVRRYDRTKRGVVPTRIEIFDAGMLFHGGSGKPIEYDDAGRPKTYRFKRSRSNHGGALSIDPVSFPAEDVIHLYRQDWPGQQRGHSIFEPVIKRFEDMDEYIEAEVVRKKIEACFAAFITPGEEFASESTDLGSPTDEVSDADFDVEVFEPGMIERLRPGDDIKFGEPKPSAAIQEFARVTLLGATAGAGVPYEAGTGDLSNVNYSSYRAGSLEFQRLCGRIQWLLIIPTFLERVWDWFLEDAYQAGLTGKRFYDIDWMPPAFESIDRGKDAKAALLEMAAGFTSRRKEVAARGWQFDDLMAEIAGDLDTTELLNLLFQGDPRPGRNTPPNDGANQQEGSQASGPGD